MSITDTFKSTPKSVLKNLVQTLKDGQEGYKKASENVKTPELKELFSRNSLERAKMAGELVTQLMSLGEDDAHKEGSSVTGMVHRGWIDLKAALTSNDDHAVLAEAERGEDAAKAAYKDALEHDLPAPIRDIVSAQAAQIQRDHDEVKRLRDATAKS